MKRKTKILFLIYFMWTVPSFAQSTYFDEYFATNIGADIGNIPVQLSSGNYLISGDEYDFTNLHPRCLFIKLDSKGDTLWSKLITTDTIGLEPIIMKQMKVNEFIVGGTAYILKNNHSEFFNMLVDSNGTIIWLKYYTNPRMLKASYLSDLVISKDNQIINVGSIADTSYRFDTSLVYVVKSDSQGNILWQSTYGSTDTRGLAVTESSTGYILAGETTIGDNFEVFNGYIAGIDSSGNLLWQKVYGEYNQLDFFSTVFKSTDGNYILGGIKNLNSKWMMKVDSEGNEIWEKSFGNNSFLEAQFWIGKVVNDGNIVFVGQESDSLHPHLSGLIMKVSQNGDSIWKHDYHYPNETYDDYFFGFQQTSDSGYIITGICHPNTQSVWLLKVDQFGCDSVGCSEATGIEPVDESNFNSVLIYPNPVHTTFFISYHLPQNTSGEVEIFNLLGRRIYYATLSPWSSIHEIDAGKWANGIYEVKVSSANQYSTLKIVKE